METRQITTNQVHLWYLILNPMRANTEAKTIVAIAYSKAALIKWHNEQLAESPYVEEGSPSFKAHGNSHSWHKTFKQSSHLEWYNPANNLEEVDMWGIGIYDEWCVSDFIVPSTAILISE